MMRYAPMQRSKADIGVVTIPVSHDPIVWTVSRHVCPFCGEGLRHPSNAVAASRIVTIGEAVNENQVTCGVFDEPDDVDLIACLACKIVFSTKESV